MATSPPRNVFDHPEKRKYNRLRTWYLFFFVSTWGCCQRKSDRKFFLFGRFLLVGNSSSSALVKQQVSWGWGRCVWKAENSFLWIYFDPCESKGNPSQSEKDGKRQIIMLVVRMKYSSDECCDDFAMLWKKRGEPQPLASERFSISSPFIEISSKDEVPYSQSIAYFLGIVKENATNFMVVWTKPNISVEIMYLNSFQLASSEAIL